MLIDEILTAPSIRQLAGENYDALRKALFRSTRFELSPAFAEAVDITRVRNPEGAWKAAHLVRPPFTSTWMEVLNVHRPFFAVIDPRSRALGRGVPKRVGCLIVDLHRARVGGLKVPPPDGVLGMCLFWSFPPGGAQPQMGSVSCILDCAAPGALDAYKAANPGEMQHYTQFSEEGLEHARLGAIPTPYMANWYRTAATYPGIVPDEQLEAAKALIITGTRDWDGEAGWWPLALMMMNSRNVSYIDTPAISPLHKKQAKRDGVEPEVVVFRTCHLHLDRIYRRHPGVTSDREVARAHFVMGHFKVRKTGVFWWSPFLRGDAGRGAVQKTYEVHP